MAYKDGIWSEVALVSIAEEGGSDVEFAGLTTSIRISEGGKPCDQVAFLDASKGVVRNPAGPIEISFEGYPLDADATDGTGIIQGYDSQQTRDTTDPFVVDSGKRRDRHRVAILLTDDDNASSGAGTHTASTNALRYILANAYITSHDWEFTGDGLKITFTFWAPALDADGNSNRRVESVDGAVTTGVLTTLQSYTSTQKW